jgi:ribose 5-phosphate isomerase B
MKVYFAADHAGFELKKSLIEFVESLGHEVEDCGAFEHDPADDYPEFISCAARKLAADSASGIDSRAIILGASGQGEAIMANRFKGVRAVVFYGLPIGSQTDASGKKLDLIESSREHNNANALSLGARFLSVDEAKDAVKKWLEQPFSGEDRHARRIQMLDSAIQ